LEPFADGTPLLAAGGVGGLGSLGAIARVSGEACSVGTAWLLDWAVGHGSIFHENGGNSERIAVMIKSRIEKSVNRHQLCRVSHEA
jgi:hypothetical protein